MQINFFDEINHLQLYFAEFLGYCIIIQVDFKLSGKSGTLITGLLTFFLLVKHGLLNIVCLF